MEEKNKEEKQGCCETQSSGCCSGGGCGCCCSGGRKGKKFFCGLLAGLLLAGAGAGLYHAGKCSAKRVGDAPAASAPVQP